MALGAIAGCLGTLAASEPVTTKSAVGSLLGYVGVGIAVIGVVLMLVAAFRHLWVAFHNSILWGLGCLFLPLVSLFHLIVYRKEPAIVQVVKWYVIGVVGLFGGIAISAFGKHMEGDQSAVTASESEEAADGAAEGDAKDAPATVAAAKREAPPAEPELPARPSIKAAGEAASITELMPVVAKLSQEWKAGSVLVRLEAAKLRGGEVDTLAGGRATFAFRVPTDLLRDPQGTLEVVYDKGGLHKTIGAGLASDAVLSWANGCGPEDAVRASGARDGSARGLFYITSKGSPQPLWIVVRDDGSDARIQSATCALAR